MSCQCADHFSSLQEYDETSTAFASDDPDPFEALCAAEDRERLWAQVSAADFLSNAEKRALLGLPPAE